MKRMTLCIPMEQCQEEQQDIRSLLQKKEMMILSNAVTKICNDCDQGKWETKKVLELTKLLGVNGLCRLDIKDILKVWRRKQELSQLPSETAVPVLVSALRKIQLNELADEISNTLHSTQRKSWKKVVGLSSVVIATLVSLSLAFITPSPIFYNTPAKVQDTVKPRGQIGIGGRSVYWIESCPTNNYTASLDNIDRTLKNYGVIQAGDEIWFCGGQASRKDGENDQSKTCKILSLLDGLWRTLEQKMNLPRIKPVMFTTGSKVIVKGGTTSDINSKTGCRDSQEVFDRDSPSLGWVREDMEENISCQISSQIVTIDCH